MYLDHSGELIPIMSACAWSGQRPPRSRARSTRTSSHSCSESTSTPSRSKITAAISDGVVAMLPIDEPLGGLAFLDGDDLADEDRMVAGVVARPEAALDPGLRLREERRTRFRNARHRSGRSRVRSPRVSQSRKGATHAAQVDVERVVCRSGGGRNDGRSARGLWHLAHRDRRRSAREEVLRGDALIDRSADRLRVLSESAARRGGVARKLARPLAEDAVFVRKLKPSLIKARARGAAPTNGTTTDVVPPLPAEEKNGGAGGD